MSLHETQVLDDYGTAEERLAARTPDEKLDWHKLIDDPELTRRFTIGNGGLSFLDAEGLRFYLPACLSRWLRDPDGQDTSNMTECLEYQLTKLDDFQLERLAILNDAQRLCVLGVLIHFREGRFYFVAELDQAIAGYWSRGT